MKIQVKKLLICLAIPLFAGALGTIFSGGTAGSQLLNQPAFSPPGWVFPVVWSILYLMMGYASYHVLVSGSEHTDLALFVYGAQLLVNILWPVVFFRFELRLTAFLILVLLGFLILVTWSLFTTADKKAGYLLIPYFLWVIFAGYLNLGAFLLN